MKYNEGISYEIDWKNRTIRSINFRNKTFKNLLELVMYIEKEKDAGMKKDFKDIEKALERETKIWQEAYPEQSQLLKMFANKLKLDIELLPNK